MPDYVLIRHGSDPPEVVEASGATISIHDRGFMYGDGLFETIRVMNGRAPLLHAHLDRLAAGALTLHFSPLPWKYEEVEAACTEMIDVNRVFEGYLRLTVTRGQSARGYEAPEEATPCLIVQAREWEPPSAVYERGYRATIAEFRIAAGSPLCRVKSLSSLEKVVARTQARRQGYDEALFLNTDGFLTEGAATNLFLVQGRSVRTPSLGCGLLPGIGRSLVIRVAEELGYVCEEARLTLEDLLSADAAFVTNSLVLAVNLAEVNGHPIGRAPEPASVTRNLYHRCLQLLTRHREGTDDTTAPRRRLLS